MHESTTKACVRTILPCWLCSDIAITRYRVRLMFDLHGSLCRDLLVGLCCYCCALVQVRVQLTGEH